MRTRSAWLSDRAHDKLYDVAVVGGGPAGLATAVYAASEGLSVVVLDARASADRPGASARIENYLGFPTGISGQALAGRAYMQAQKFGARDADPGRGEIARLLARRRRACASTDGGQLMRARSVVVASGARYRRPEIENLGEFEGRGVWFWASPIEAGCAPARRSCWSAAAIRQGRPAVFLVQHARRVYMLIRGGGLAASMSRYLIERIEATPNIELLLQYRGDGARTAASEGTLERVRWQQPPRGPRATSISATCSCSSAPIRPPAGWTAAASRSIASASC